MLVVMWNYDSRNMTGRNLYINVLFLVLAIIFSAISQCSSVLSDKRLCYDPDCSEPISLARTTMKYAPKEPDLLPFTVNVEVKVYSKEAGSRPDLWGVEINGRRGYAPKLFLKEYKVLRKDLKYTVPTSPLVTNNATSNEEHKPKEKKEESKFDAKDIQTSSIPFDNSDSKSTKELSDKKIDATPSLVVIDGTKVPVDQDVPSIGSFSVSEAIESTIVPNGHGIIDHSEIKSANGNAESNIFTDSDKVSEQALINKLGNEKQNVPDKVDINDYVTNSEVALDLPEVTGVQIPPLNKSAISNNIDQETRSIKDEQVTASNVSQTVTSDENKEALNVDDKAAIAVGKENSLNFSNVQARNGTTLNVQNVKSTDKVGANDAQALESTAIVADTVIKPDIQSAESSEKHEARDARPSESATIVATGDTKADVQSAEGLEKHRAKDVQISESVTMLVTNDTKPDVQVTESSNKLQTKETKSAENETAVVTNDTEADVQSAESLDKHGAKGAQISENVTMVVTNDTKPDVQVTESSNKLQTKETKSAENETAVVTNDTEADVQSAESLDKHGAKGAQISENVTMVVTNDTKPHVQVAESSDKLQTKETKSAENETAVVTNDTEADVQSAESLDKHGAKGAQISENVTMVVTNDTKPDVQVTESSDKLQTKETKSAENETVLVPSDTKTVIENVTSSQKINTKGKHPLENIGTDTEVVPSSEDTTENSDETKVEDTNKSEGITVDANNNTISETGADNTGKIDVAGSQFAESFSTDTKGLPSIGNVGQLGMEETESGKENESESKEDLRTYNRNEYGSPLFLHLNAKNEVPMAIPSDNIKAATQSKETINELDTKDVQSDLHAEDTTSTRETTSGLQSNSYIVENTLVAEAAVDADPDLNIEDAVSEKEAPSQDIILEELGSSPVICTSDIDCSLEDNIQNSVVYHEQSSADNENVIMEGIHLDSNYWITLMYLSVTAIATLIFSLGYYSIENMRRDKQLIARINKLEKDLLISEAECTMVNENLKSTKEKLKRMEDESFGSDEMVLSLRADLEASQNAKTQLEDQVAMLEKDLESATEAGLELEKMLREVLSSNNEVNPLAQSVEDLQTRLNAQQAANESLTNALTLKTQENETLSTELATVKKKYEELEVEFSRVTENLRLELTNKNSIVETLNDKVQQLEMQIKEISTQKATLQKELKGKEVEVKDLVEVISKLKSNNLDLDKLYEVSHIKAEAATLLEERDELKIRLTEVEGAHNLLEEHMKVIKEEVATLSEQCKLAEKEKKDAETRLEVLTNFFEEKEAQRQKEEAIWLQQQGEVVSTVERIQTMQNEIQNYKQQIEMLKREILDQEREYKNQISLLETKAHEQWVIARQVERRLEESKVEAGQLRNRLTLIEKNINDAESEAKLHRLEANGESTTMPPFIIGAEPSSSPIMFSGSTTVPPPPPPSYLHSLFPHYLPPPLPNTHGVPPYEVSQRPPPLGGRLSSPPPMPLHPSASNRYDNAVSPPPMPPHLLPPFNHRPPPPPPPFGSDMHPPPPSPPGSILPPSLGTPHSWGEESLPFPRNSGFHPSQRERVRNHKGSLHSSGESLDKSHHSKV